MLTIFTATYNRSKYLSTLYNSLVKQSNYNFEWLVIDDGSIDDTEKYIKEIQNFVKRFDIRFYSQEHGGKHRAMNKAFDLARGKYFFPVDSDDYLTENAVELVLKWIEGIRKNDKIVGVSGLKAFSLNNIIGEISGFKDDYIDASVFEKDKYFLGGIRQRRG